jgi:hypothetical protein
MGDLGSQNSSPAAEITQLQAEDRSLNSVEPKLRVIRDKWAKEFTR